MFIWDTVEKHQHKGEQPYWILTILWVRTNDQSVLILQTSFFVVGLWAKGNHHFSGINFSDIHELTVGYLVLPLQYAWKSQLIQNIPHHVINLGRLCGACKLNSKTTLLTPSRFLNDFNVNCAETRVSPFFSTSKPIYIIRSPTEDTWSPFI